MTINACKLLQQSLASNAMSVIVNLFVQTQIIPWMLAKIGMLVQNTGLHCYSSRIRSILQCPRVVVRIYKIGRWVFAKNLLNQLSKAHVKALKFLSSTWYSRWSFTFGTFTWARIYFLLQIVLHQRVRWTEKGRLNLLLLIKSETLSLKINSASLSHFSRVVHDFFDGYALLCGTVRTRLNLKQSGIYIGQIYKDRGNEPWISGIYAYKLKPAILVIR